MTLGSVLNDSGLNRYMLPPGTTEHFMILRNDIILVDLLQAPATSPPQLFLRLSIRDKTEVLDALCQCGRP